MQVQMYQALRAVAEDTLALMEQKLICFEMNFYLNYTAVLYWNEMSWFLLFENVNLW